MIYHSALGGGLILSAETIIGFSLEALKGAKTCSRVQMVNMLVRGWDLLLQAKGHEPCGPLPAEMP